MLDLGPLRSEFTRPAHRKAAIAATLRAHAEHSGIAAKTAEDLVLCGCLPTLLDAYMQSAGGERGPMMIGNLPAPLAAANDEEGTAVPQSLPPVIDGHVHLFPDKVFFKLWSWFEAYAWPIRYKLQAPEAARFMLDRGVQNIIGLHYAHKPGLARPFNAFMAELCKAEPRIVGFATVFPGEPDAVDILREAVALGLKGVKLHCHVQGFAADSPQALEVFRACDELGLPVLIHAGREPRSAMYPVDPHLICHADRLETALRAFPKLRICVPHFGSDEVSGYQRLLSQCDNLYLDTTMMLSGFMPVDTPDRLLRERPERIFYGTDFPNLPYAWDRELKALTRIGLTDDALAAVLSGAAQAFLGAQ